MITNPLFRQCLADVPDNVRAEFDLSFEIADRIAYLLNKKGLSPKDLAVKMGKRESEVASWLTGRHIFTTKTLAGISRTLGEPVIYVAS